MTVSRMALGAAVIATGASIFNTAGMSTRDMGSGRGDGHPKSYECTSTALVVDYVLGARCTARGGAPEKGNATDVVVVGPEQSFRCGSTYAGDVNAVDEGRVKTLTGYRCKATG
ncbi:hypothetical protein [Nocardia sp. NPDC051570]|uniref:hypothetical protein n=1 Tax=Nocardia sp. NPDC051570 TaxID=3364324 RepID=UPI00379F302F